MHLYMSLNISKLVYAKLENIASSALRVHHRKMHDLKNCHKTLVKLFTDVFGYIFR